MPSFKPGDVVLVPKSRGPYRGKGTVHAIATWDGVAMVCVYVREHSHGHIWIPANQLEVYPGKEKRAKVLS